MSGADTGIIRGLPEPLPADESLLWQGSPHWQSVARRAFRVRELSIYFVLLIAMRQVTLLVDGAPLSDVMTSIFTLSSLAAAAIGILVVLSWLIGRTTVYSLTSRRLVLHSGIALPMTVNIPYRTVQSARLNRFRDGLGDIVFELPKDVRLAYLQLWPHVRPWHYSNPQPMLRSVDNAENVAGILAAILSEGSSQPALWQQAPVPADAPAHRPSRAAVAA